MPTINRVNTHTALIKHSVEIIDDASHFISNPNRQTRSQKIYNTSNTLNAVTSELNQVIHLLPPPTDSTPLPYTVVETNNVNVVNSTKFLNLNSGDGEFYLQLSDGVSSITLKTNQFSFSTMELGANPNLIVAVGNATNPSLQKTLSIQIIRLGEG